MIFKNNWYHFCDWKLEFNFGVFLKCTNQTFVPIWNILPTSKSHDIWERYLDIWCSDGSFYQGTRSLKWGKIIIVCSSDLFCTNSEHFIWNQSCTSWKRENLYCWSIVVFGVFAPGGPKYCSFSLFVEITIVSLDRAVFKFVSVKDNKAWVRNLSSSNFWVCEDKKFSFGGCKILEFTA